MMPKTKSIREGLRKGAEARKAESDKLTTQQKLDKLPPTGANRQRARYLALLEKEANKSTSDKKENAK